MAQVLALVPQSGPAGHDPVRISAVMSAWSHLLEGLGFAFQPIVQMRTGRCHGLEALVRGWERFGFGDPHGLFDAAKRADVLIEVETALQRKAIERFKQLHGWEQGKLFLNVSAEVVTRAEAILRFAAEAGVSIVHELPERSPTAQGDELEAAMRAYRRLGANVALDDFGVGFAGLRLLYEARPEYVKIDRFFIQDIDTDHRKRAIVSYLVSYAHTLGIATIAEGIETTGEFYACRDIGCDFAQGYLIGRPDREMAEFPAVSDVVRRLNDEDRRRPEDARNRLMELIERIPPLKLNAPKAILLERFGSVDAGASVPVVDAYGVPKGLVRERDLKPFVYSAYGPDLLRNRVLGSGLADFVAPCPVCDINSPLERVIEVYAEDAGSDGVIIVEGGAYLGFLSNQALIRLLHARRLETAADQNPLTRLPGNTAIARHVEDLLAETEQDHAFVYFDFDNFKPFNDHFGFRQGDRAILMFSERLKVMAAALGGFAGHVGGDDFVLTVSGPSVAAIDIHVSWLLKTFVSDIECFYDPETRSTGVFRGIDRDGNPRAFPLLSVSAVQLMIRRGGAGRGRLEHVLGTLSRHKAAAKRSSGRFLKVYADEAEETTPPL